MLADCVEGTKVGKHFPMTNRHEAILDYLDIHGAATYQELQKHLHVSSMTVRRSIQSLSKSGAVIKALGGAQRLPGSYHLEESPILSRLSVGIRLKQSIAIKACELLQHGQTLFIDGGTTCIQFARKLAKEHEGLTIITNSALISLELGSHSKHAVICMGGEYHANTGCFVGAMTDDACRSFFVDISFLSTKGFIPSEGTFESAVANLRVKQLMAKQSARTVLLADHTKFGQRSLRKVLDVDQIHAVVCDKDTPAGDVSFLRSRGIDVELAQ